MIPQNPLPPDAKAAAKPIAKPIALNANPAVAIPEVQADAPEPYIAVVLSPKVAVECLAKLTEAQGKLGHIRSVPGINVVFVDGVRMLVQAVIRELTTS